jgi:uncharacterized protein (DUF2225 family)
LFALVTVIYFACLLTTMLATRDDAHNRMHQKNDIENKAFLIKTNDDSSKQGGGLVNRDESLIGNLFKSFANVCVCTVLFSYSDGTEY